MRTQCVFLRSFLAVYEGEETGIRIGREGGVEEGKERDTQGSRAAEANGCTPLSLLRIEKKGGCAGHFP